MFDLRKLKGRIVEMLGSQNKFSEKMGWSERTTSLKISGKIDWKQSEIVKAASILKIPDNEIVLYFFKQKVQNIEQKRKSESD